MLVTFGQCLGGEMAGALLFSRKQVSRDSTYQVCLLVTDCSSNRSRVFASSKIHCGHTIDGKRFSIVHDRKD